MTHKVNKRMPRNTLKTMARNKKIKLGHFIVEFATPGIGHIMKAAGCEFALFDLEHSGFGFETVKSAIRYFEAADVAPIVRVPSKEYHHIARACDMGAEGIMLPMVGNAKPLARLLGLPYFPVTPFFPLAGPVGMVPLPSKWHIQFGEPIPTTDYDESAADDPMITFELTDQVRETIQQTLYQLLANRRNMFLG